MKKNAVGLRFSRRKTELEPIIDILKTTSDYQHDDITVEAFGDFGNTDAIIVDIYTEETSDIARTREALHRLVDYLLDN